MSDRLKVEIKRTKRENADRAEWWFTIVDLSNGKALARSTEGYYNYDEMLDCVRSVTGGVLAETKAGYPVEPRVIVRKGDLPPIVVQGDAPAGRR